MNIELKCDYCERIYKSNSARILHYRKQHNELYENDKLIKANYLAPSAPTHFMLGVNLIF